jgi:hypothetical protein
MFVPVLEHSPKAISDDEGEKQEKNEGWKKATVKETRDMHGGNIHGLE